MPLLFDGTDDYVNVSAVAGINNIFNGAGGSQGGTIMAWVLANGWGEIGFGRILDKASSTGAANGWSWQLQTGRMRFEAGFTIVDPAWQSPDSGLSLSTTYHLAVTYNDDSSANDPQMFVNGQSVTVTENTTPAGSYQSDAPYDMRIGQFSGGTNRTFDGAIWDVRMYDRILADDEIASVWNSDSRDGNLDDIAAWWPLDEGPPDTAASGVDAVHDYVGGHHGTPGNNPQWVQGWSPQRRTA